MSLIYEGYTSDILCILQGLYVTANVHRCGGTSWTPTANRTNAKDKKSKSPTREIIQQNLASGPTESMQNTVHKLVKGYQIISQRKHCTGAPDIICSKGISAFFITSTTVADQRLLLGFINILANRFLLSFHFRRAHQTGAWSLVWISCWIVFQKFVVP